MTSDGYESAEKRVVVPGTESLRSLKRSRIDNLVPGNSKSEGMMNNLDKSLVNCFNGHKFGYGT